MPGTNRPYPGPHGRGRLTMDFLRARRPAFDQDTRKRDILGSSGTDWVEMAALVSSVS